MNEETRKKQEDKLNQYISKAVNYRKVNKDTEYTNNMAYYEGLQWNLADMSDGKPFLVYSDINHVKNAVDLRFASLYANDYIGDLLPLSAEDEEVVNKLEIAYASEWKRLKMDEKVKHVIKLGGILGEGYLVLNYDLENIHGGTNAKMEGTPTVSVLPTTSVYVDPSATNFYDADYVVCRNRKTSQWFKRKKPDWFKKLKEIHANEGGNTVGNDVGEIFAGHDYSTEQDNLITLDIVYEKVLKTVEVTTMKTEIQTDETGQPIEVEVPVKEKVKKCKVDIHYMVDGNLLETNTNYPFEEFPIFQFGWEEMEQSPYCIPLMRGLTTPQKVINLIESAINNLAIHFTIPTILVSDESGLDAKTVSKLSGAAGVVYKVSGEPSKALTYLRPPSIDINLVNIKDSFIGNIREYAGVTNAYQGQIGTAGNTSSGTDQAVARATMIDSIPLTQIEKFIERVTKMFVRYIAHYNAGETMYVRKEKTEEGKWTFDNFTIEENAEFVNFDYAVDLAIKTQNNKDLQLQKLTNFYQLQNQYKDPVKVIKSLDLIKAADLDNYDELFKRYSAMSETDIQEKVNLITELMTIAQTPKPDGTPLIDQALIQDAITDVINDDGDLSFAEQIFAEYESYQEQLLALENQISQENTQNLQ